MDARVRLGAALLLLLAFRAGVYRAPRLDTEQARALQESLRATSEKEPGKALAAARRLLASFPENPLYLFEEARLTQRLGLWQESAAAWELYLQTGSNPVDACPDAAQVYEKLDKPERALETLRRCLTFEPENTDLLFYLAHALERRSEYGEAAALYEKALKLAPDYADVATGLARIQMFQGDLGQAAKTVGRVLARTPGDVDALLVDGLVALRSGDLSHARRSLEKGHAASPGYGEMTEALRHVYEKQGDKKALEAFK